MRPPPTDVALNHISQEFQYNDLVEATEHFNAKYRLGEGTYGTVFRGTMRDGTEVAIKSLASPKEGGFREEVEVLSKFRHPNLVILMGFARHGRERYLIYELLPGGDLNARVTKDLRFTWSKRLSVCLDATLGLSHLHASRPQVFHRDVKTQNILMDKNGTGKVADFGLACLAAPNQRSLTCQRASGTIGYADPLYIQSGVVTEKSEVYSMGMVLLEVLTGRPPALQHPNGRIEYQFEHLNGDIRRLAQMVDKRGQWPPSMVEKLGMLALHCTCGDDKRRPTFVEIVKQLRAWLREPVDEPPADDRGGSASSGVSSEYRRGSQNAGGHATAYAAGGQHAQHAQQQQAHAHAQQMQQQQQQAPWPHGAGQQHQQQQQPHAARARDASPRRPPAEAGARAGGAGGIGYPNPFAIASPGERDARGQEPARLAQQRAVAGQPAQQASQAAPAAQAAPVPRPKAPVQRPQDQPAGGVRAHWPQATPQAAAGQAGQAGQAGHAAQATPQAPQVTSSSSIDREQLIKMSKELGLSREQAGEAAAEAIKRCSTIEAAMEWIVVNKMG